jgi:DNA mismatch repair ATPase MutS
MLLDEILRGTNSADRHAGTRALIRDILAYGGVALLASHDLDLCSLESRYPIEVSNYHFDISLVEGQLQFDYRLRPGVCRNMNASFLLGQIGLQLLPEDYDSPRNG